MKYQTKDINHANFTEQDCTFVDKKTNLPIFAWKYNLIR